MVNKVMVTQTGWMEIKGGSGDYVLMFYLLIQGLNLTLKHEGILSIYN